MNSATGTEPASLMNALRAWIAQPFVASFIGGGMAAVTSRTVVSPLERAKVLIQVGSAGNDNYRLGMVKILKKMLVEEGIKGWYRGHASNLVRLLPYSSIQFASYSTYKSYLETTPGAPLSTVQRLFCGALAGMTSVICTYPLDIARTRLSVQTASFDGLKANSGPKPPGMFGVMKEMYLHEGGIRAFTKGLAVTAAGVGPYIGCSFACYEAIRDHFTSEGQSAPSALGKMGAGAIAGAFAQTITYPMDVLRRKLQVSSMAGVGRQYSGVWDAVSTTVKQDGVQGLYRGLGVNLAKVAPAMGVSFWTFEATRDFLVACRPDDDI